MDEFAPRPIYFGFDCQNLHRNVIHSNQRANSIFKRYFCTRYIIGTFIQLYHLFVCKNAFRSRQSHITRQVHPGDINDQVPFPCYDEGLGPLNPAKVGSFRSISLSSKVLFCEQRISHFFRSSFKVRSPKSKDFL